MLKSVHSPNFMYRYYRGSRNGNETMACISANQKVMEDFDADLVALITLRTLLGTRARFRTRSTGLVKGAGIDEMVAMWEQQVTLLVCKVEGLGRELQNMRLDVLNAKPTTVAYSILTSMPGGN